MRPSPRLGVRGEARGGTFSAPHLYLLDSSYKRDSIGRVSSTTQIPQLSIASSASITAQAMNSIATNVNRPPNFDPEAGKSFETLIGYTRGPADGSEPSVDDLASENPVYRDIRKAKVHDVRGQEGLFNLEEHGFQYYKLPAIPGEGTIDFHSEQDPLILGIYYPGIAEWFAKV